MIAGTILMGRALAPIEQTIAQWSAIQQAYAAWTRIKDSLSRPVSLRNRRLSPVSGRAHQCLEPRGYGTRRQPGLYWQGLNFFETRPWQCCRSDRSMPPGGVRQKSALARALAGIWPAVRGEIRLGSVLLEQYPKLELGTHFRISPPRY